MAKATSQDAEILVLRHRVPSARRPMRWAGWARARHGFLVFAILVLMGVHLGLNDSSGANNVVTEDRLAPLLHAMVLAGLGLVVLGSPVRAGRGLWRLAPFLLLPALAAASTTWSAAPGASASATASLLSTIALAVVCWAVTGTRTACRIQVQAMMIAALASLAAGVLIPGSAFDTGDNAHALRGVFSQKNSLGEMMFVGLVAWSYVVLRDRRITHGAAMTAAVALLTVLLSRSMTALLLSSITVVATLLMLLRVRRSPYAVPALLAVLAAAGAVATIYVVDTGTLYAWMGKSSDLTGRVQIWDSISLLNGSPTLLGAGYSAFWSPSSAVAQAIWNRTHFVTQSAHNGYLETQLELGNVGLALLLALLGLTLVRAVRCWRSGARVSPFWALLIVGLIAIYNLDEVSWPKPDIHLFQWMLAYLSCRRRPPPREVSSTEAMRGLRAELDALGFSSRGPSKGMA